MRCYTDISPGIPPFVIVWTPQQIENTQPDDIHVRLSQTGATQTLMRGSVLCWCWSFSEIKTNNLNTEPHSNQCTVWRKILECTLGKNQANWSEQDCAAALHYMMGAIWNCNCISLSLSAASQPEKFSHTTACFCLVTTTTDHREQGGFQTFLLEFYLHHKRQGQSPFSWLWKLSLEPEIGRYREIFLYFPTRGNH